MVMKKTHSAIIVFIVLVLLGLLWRSSIGAKLGLSASKVVGAEGQKNTVKRPIRTGADEATIAGRNAGNRLVRVSVQSQEDRDAAQQLGKVIEDYGSFVVLAVGGSRIGGKAFQAFDEIETNISLRGYSFEPLRESPERAFAGRRGMVKSASDGGDYYIVQFVAPARDEWLEEISAAGGEVLQYVPNQAFFVYATPEAMATISDHPRVRWTGAFHPLYKLSPEMRQIAAAQNTAPAEFDIAVFKQANLPATASTIRDFGALILNNIVLPGNFFNVVRVVMEPELALPIAQIPGVISIEPYIRPAREDERAAHIVAGNFSSTTMIDPPGYNSLTQFGVDGTNVTVAVVDDGVGIPGDGGFYITSGNTVNGPLRGASAGALGHGHLNASIIAGDLPFSAILSTLR